MKNISYLFLATILFFSNCSKDNGVDEILSEEIVNITEADLITEADSITEADLVGDWDFVSLKFEGEIYTNCNNELLGKYNLLNLSFLNVTLKSELYGVPTLIYFSNCGNTTSSERRFNIEDNIIYLYNEFKIKYLILNYKTFYEDNYLVLELNTSIKSIPNGGIYTLKKRL